MTFASRPALLLCALVLAVCAAPAAGQPPAGTLAPPGASGVDQYVETVPSVKGPARTRRGGGERRVPPPGAGADALPAETRLALQALGKDGQGVERLQDATGQAADPSQRDEVVKAASGRTGVVAAAVSRGATGDSGMGVALPALLVLVIAGAAAMWWVRRRRPAVT